MAKEFLTVMAVLDDETQKTLFGWQQAMLTAGLKGTQTMSIPFHITLGSFAPDCEEALLGRVRRAAEETAAFPIRFTAWNTFGRRVLFVQPDESFALTALHGRFDRHEADPYPWTPHTTLFMGEEKEVEQAIEIVKPLFRPLHARITAIELGFFFPHRFIGRYELK